MSKAKKALAADLQAAVLSHLPAGIPTGKLSPAIARAMQKLTKAVARQRQRMEDERAGRGSAKQERRALVALLLPAVRPYLALDADQALPANVVKRTKRLATELVEHRRQQAQAAPPVARPADEVRADDPAADLSSRRPRRQATVRRPAKPGTGKT